MPVFAFFFLEYNRYSPLFIFRIMRPLAADTNVFRGVIGSLCASGWPFWRRGFWMRCFAFWPPCGLAATESCETPLNDLSSSALGWLLAIALKISFSNATAPVRNRARLFLSCWPKSCRCSEGRALHLLFVLSRGRSRWPALSTPHRAFLPVHGAFPPARILRLACWAIFLRAHPRELVRSFLVPA